MMSFSLADQTAYFLWSLVLGLALGAAYDLLRAVRMLVRAKGTGIVLTDIAFFAACGIVTSLFALPLNRGGVRAFVMFGEAVGFLTYRFTLGSVMGKFYSHSAVFLRSFIQIIHKILEKFFDLLLKLTSVLVYNIKVVIYKSKKKLNDRRRSAAASKEARRGRDKEIYNNEQKRKETKTGFRQKNRWQR